MQSVRSERGGVVSGGDDGGGERAVPEVDGENGCGPL